MQIWFNCLNSVINKVRPFFRSFFISLFSSLFLSFVRLFVRSLVRSFVMCVRSFCRLFHLPGGEHINKLWISVPWGVDVVLQVKTISA